MVAVSRDVYLQELWVYGSIGAGVSWEDPFTIPFMYALLAGYNICVCGANPEMWQFK